MHGGPYAAITTKELPVPPDTVCHILADGRRYADWVVGASHVRDVELDWPAIGSKFHHTVGVWPFHPEITRWSKSVPKGSGDRVKTDRRDARRLAGLHRAGELTQIGIPTPAQRACAIFVALAVTWSKTSPWSATG